MSQSQIKIFLYYIMGYCSFCNEEQTPTYWDYYCENCAMLRRLLKIHNSKKCCEILKRVLIRNPTQIGYKIDAEITEDNSHKFQPKTRSQSKKECDKTTKM